MYTTDYRAHDKMGEAELQVAEAELAMDEAMWEIMRAGSKYYDGPKVFPGEREAEVQVLWAELKVAEAELEEIVIGIYGKDPLKC